MFLDDQIVATVKELTEKKVSANLIKSDIFVMCINKMKTDYQSIGIDKAYTRVCNYFDLAANKLNKLGNHCIQAGQFKTFINKSTSNYVSLH